MAVTARERTMCRSFISANFLVIDKISPESATYRRAGHAELAANSDALSPVYTAVAAIYAL